MKKIILYISCTLFIFGCGHMSENAALVESYEKHYNAKNESEILALITDDFTIEYQKEFTEIDGKDDFITALKWGEIMNSNNKTTIISESENYVITTEKYTNDRERLLKIPSTELKATYFIKNGKISKIVLDTLDNGRSKIDSKRNKELEPFKAWCELNIGYSEFEYSEEGAVKLKTALINYSNK